MNVRYAIALLLCAAPALADKPAEAAPAKAAPAPAPKKFTVDSSQPMPPGLDEKAMDPSANPCDDFYQYACGGWLATNEIPADKPLFSRGFVSIQDRNEQNLKAILDEAAANKLPAGTPFAKQLGDFYATCTDEAKLEKSLPEVKALVTQLTSFKSNAELGKVVGLAHQAGVSAFFRVGSEQDFKDSTQVILGVDQGGLGLPDRDYYLTEDERSQKIRAAYLAHLEAVFKLAGEKPEAAKAIAAEVMALETRLAKVSLTRVDRREPEKVYHRLERAGLKEKAGGFDWETYLNTLGLKTQTAINVTTVPFFEELSALTKDTKPEVLKHYLTWWVLRESTPALPKAFQDEDFAFTSQNFSGAKEDRPRWKKCVTYANAALGEALGREYTRRFFPEASKQRTSAMVAALQAAFEKNLATLPWMDEPTRAAARAKVQRMVGNNKIGFPDEWRDYSSVKTTRTSFFANALATDRFEVARELKKLGKPVDRKEWGMTPPTVNAYNDGQKNEIVFPAGILQPPFFSAEASDAVNFGSMGMVVGHEITHGFDDQGRKFDVEGNLKDWWSPASGKQFIERAACVKRQYDGYVAVDDVKLKGDLTLGENVADLGGLKLAHAAMLDWYAKKGADPVSRYTVSQQFFLGMAQAWCTKVRPESARLRAATDPHSPPYWRVNGPLGNLDAFSAAFQCSEGSKMLRTGADRCSVW